MRLPLYSRLTICATTRLTTTLLITTLLSSSFATPAPPTAITQDDSGDPVDLVDPFIGVDGGGNVPPGVCLPFSMMRLSPDTKVPQVTSGYSSKDNIIGFSHTHTSGTGGAGRYGNILVTPQTGPVVLDDSSSHIEESASPGYYTVRLTKPDVKVELTATERCGYHRYSFTDGTTQGRLLINVSAVRTGRASPYSRSNCTSAHAKFVSDSEVEGYVTAEGGWGNRASNTVWFVAQFDKPAANLGSWQYASTHPGQRDTTGTNCGVYAEFKLTPKTPIQLRVGISFSSLKNARKHLAQTDHQSFEQVHKKACDVWRTYLSRIDVHGGTRDQRICFYTGLYHTFLMPTDITSDNPDPRFKLPHFWDYYCIWDTWHCTNPLYTLIAPEKEAQLVNCLTEIYKVRGWLPDAWVSGDFAYIQGGTNADIVLGDAIVKKLPGIDREFAYEAIHKDATTPSDNALRYGRYPEYFQLGYLPCDDITSRGAIYCPSSRTIEYSIDDFALANAAASLGKPEDARKFTSQSLTLYKLFNPETKFFWARDRAGNFLPGFDADYRTPSGYGPFYEGTPWHYAFYVPHDLPGLISRHGGAPQFTAILDQLFDTNRYNPGNEPDLLSPWLYSYVGRPDKNADHVQKILATNYGTSRSGLPGNDDAGAMSSWYVFGAMGFFPNAGQDLYLLSAPIFSQISMKVAEGKNFRITARNLSETNKYVLSARLNGQKLERAWLRHSEIIAGGELELQMGSQPVTWGNGEPPHSAVAALLKL